MHTKKTILAIAVTTFFYTCALDNKNKPNQPRRIEINGKKVTITIEDQKNKTGKKNEEDETVTGLYDLGGFTEKADKKRK